MMVQYRIHEFNAPTLRTFFIVEELFYEGWREVLWYGRRLEFSSARTAFGFIEAIDPRNTEAEVYKRTVVN